MGDLIASYHSNQSLENISSVFYLLRTPRSWVGFFHLASQETELTALRLFFSDAGAGVVRLHAAGGRRAGVQAR